MLTTVYSYHCLLAIDWEENMRLDDYIRSLSRYIFAGDFKFTLTTDFYKIQSEWK